MTERRYVVQTKVKMRRGVSRKGEKQATIRRCQRDGVSKYRGEQPSAETTPPASKKGKGVARTTVVRIATR